MDGFFGIGFLELILIAVVALIVLGPERLPGVMREVASVIRRVRQLTSEFTSQFGEEFRALEDLNPRKLINEMTDPNRPDPAAKPSEQAPKPPTPNVRPVTPAAPPKPPVPTSRPVAPVAATTAAQVTGEPAQPVSPGQPTNSILPPERAESATAAPSPAPLPVPENPVPSGPLEAA